MSISKLAQVNLLEILKSRFENHKNRHPKINWNDVYQKLIANPQKLWSISEMERTGGEPDVVGFDNNTQEYLFVDCSTESPKDRRSLCYDQSALNSRKENKPKDSAENQAATMGIELLTEKDYGDLQKLDAFDLKSQSWLKTPPQIRQLGGAIFADRRYDHVFIYHNGAESYYAARGFRGKIRV